MPRHETGSARIGKVLPDGHLSLPEGSAKEVGKLYGVILVPLEEAEVSFMLRP